MTNTLFLQSDVQDPYAIYNERLAAGAVYTDVENKLRAVYSYILCRELLGSPLALVPPVAASGLNEYALAIAGRLVRLSNTPGHTAARQAALYLMQCMKPARAEEIMLCLLPEAQSEATIDWVDSIARQLPALYILEGFEMDRADAGFILRHIGAMIKIMQPVKTGEVLVEINAIAKEIYCLLEKHILRKTFLTEVMDKVAAGCLVSTGEALALCVSNIAGLLIQAYDAGRGILSNALLQLLRHNNLPVLSSMDRSRLQRCVVETLRFDPPVHNTRRIAAETITPGDYEINKGETILLVMAAANRDPQRFAHPGQYDTARHNNREHLTFGFGAHECVANHLSTHIATEALWYLFQHYSIIGLQEPAIQYEPLVNVRLPKRMLLSLRRN